VHLLQAFSGFSLYEKSDSFSFLTDSSMITSTVKKNKNTTTALVRHAYFYFYAHLLVWK
jgi:hypothetical protein